MAFKTFAPGVLTSSDVNTFLMRQAVITCTSSTRPASPSEGMTIYETDNDRYMVYDGAAWVSGLETGYKTFTPTLSGAATGWSLGTPNELVGRYTRVGNTVLVDVYLEFGSSAGTVGSGPFAFLVPFSGITGASYGIAGHGTGRMRRASDANIFPLHCEISGNARLTALGYINSTGVVVGYAALDTTSSGLGVPIPVANGDRWEMHWIYETSAS